MTYKNTSLIRIEIPQIPDKLPYAIDDMSLAHHLGIRNTTLWWLIHTIHDHYSTTKIPKKTGGVRVIHNPSERLRYVQQNIQNKILTPLQEDLGNHVTAYRAGRSLKDAAKRHIPECSICDSALPGETAKKHPCPRRGTLIHLDLKDFFPRTTPAMIRTYFMSVGYSHHVSGLITALLTLRNIPNPKWKKGVPENGPKYFGGVPQGSITAGAVCNLVADKLLDTPLMAYLKTLNTFLRLKDPDQFVYSRYSDDITISCGRVLTPEELSLVLSQIKSYISSCGYKVNKDKTRIASEGRPRVVLGIMTNRKVNISRRRYQKFDAIIHNCVTGDLRTQMARAGKKTPEELLSWIRGNVNWISQVSPEKGEYLKQEFLKICVNLP